MRNNAMQEFRALVVTELPDGMFERQIVEQYLRDLPGGDVLTVEHQLDELSGLIDAGGQGNSLGRVVVRVANA